MLALRSAYTSFASRPRFAARRLEKICSALLHRMRVAPRLCSDSRLAVGNVRPRTTGAVRHGFAVAGLPVVGSLISRNSPSLYFAHAASLSAWNVVLP